jgi:hypothetical protein
MGSDSIDEASLSEVDEKHLHIEGEVSK